jgi:prepilin-type N-terminal cleavage/methylation domain-containing protein
MTSRAGPEAGFTLLEMACVLAIVGPLRRQRGQTLRVPDDVRFEALLPREIL